MFTGFLGSFAPIPGVTSRYTSLKEDGHEQVRLAGGGLRAWSTGPFLLDRAAPTPGKQFSIPCAFRRRTPAD